MHELNSTFDSAVLGWGDVVVGQFFFVQAIDVGVYSTADIGVVDLDDPKCKFSRVDDGSRLSLHNIGDSKFVVSDVLTGCVTIPLEGQLELVTAEDMATVIDIRTHEMTGLTPLLDKDVIRDDKGLGECWLCRQKPDGKLFVLESFDDAAAHHEPGSK